jgi:hypothetical protein
MHKYIGGLSPFSASVEASLKLTPLLQSGISYFLFFILIITVNLDGYFGAHVRADRAACAFSRVFRGRREKAALIKIIC